MLDNALIASMLTSPNGRRRASVPRRRQSDPGSASDAKKISFNPRVQYHAVPYLSEIEKGSVWYTGKEYVAAREREDFIRRKVSENDALFRKNEENLIAQGVLTNHDILRKIQAVDSSVVAVLEEQDEQEVKFQLAQQKARKSKKKQNKGDAPMIFTVNEDKLAKVYKSHSKKALKEAQNRAFRHEKHLKDIASEESIPEPSISPSRVRRDTFNRSKHALPPSMATKAKNPLMHTRRPLPALGEVDETFRASRCANPAA